MKLYAVHFEDEPSAQDVREQHQQAHLRWLGECGSRIVQAGVLHREGDGTPIGGLWVLRASSELDARGLIEADPYFIHGLRRTVRVWPFTPSLGE